MAVPENRPAKSRRLKRLLMCSASACSALVVISMRGFHRQAQDLVAA